MNTIFKLQLDKCNICIEKCKNYKKIKNKELEIKCETCKNECLYFFKYILNKNLIKDTK